MKSYSEHIQSISNNLQIQDNLNNNIIKSRPIFRSSAIFPILINKFLNVRLLFLGYWIIKKNINSITCILTIRNEKGSVLYRNDFIINKVKSYEIDIKKTIDKFNVIKDNIVSAEIEFFSDVNLVFPYPAVTINYFSKFSSTFVHSTSRIYNDYYDKLNNNKILVKESGFDLFNEKDSEPFIAFVNGPNIIKNKVLIFEFINPAGKILKYKKKISTLLPFQTTFIGLKFNKSIVKFINNSNSTVKVSHKFNEFYPRFLVGNFNKAKTMISLTHSYYDTSTLKQRFHFWNNINKSEYEDAVFSMPLFQNYLTDLIIYPIISVKSPIYLSIKFYDKNKLIISNENIFIIESDLLKRKSISLNSLLGELKKTNQNLVAKISLNSKKEIPSRLKFGMNIRQNKKNIYPTNICFNARLSSMYSDNKPSAFKWAPLINHKNSFFHISNISFRKSLEKNANIILKFWRKKDDKFLLKKIIIKENSFYNFILSENKKIKNFLEDGPGWVTIQSNNSNLDAWYFEDMNKGILGGDHFF